MSAQLPLIVFCIHVLAVQQSGALPWKHTVNKCCCCTIDQCKVKKKILIILSQWLSSASCVVLVFSFLLMMLRRKTFFVLLKIFFLYEYSTIVLCDFFGKRSKRFPSHMTFLRYVYMNLNYHLAGQTWSIPCPCVFSPQHKLTSSHCKHFLYSSPSLCTKS